MSDDVTAETAALHDVAREGTPTERVCSEFVEREARRMCFAHSGWKPDTLVTARVLPHGPMGSLVLDWACAAPAWHLYVPLVRSVLEGLRKPTQGMVSRGIDFFPWGRKHDLTTDFYIAGTFSAMIDAALEDGA